MSTLLAAATISPTTSSPTGTIPLITSALSNVAWDHVPGRYRSHVPLVPCGLMGPFSSTDWSLIRIALARTEAARKGAALIQIHTVLQTVLALPLHRVDRTREEIMAMAETFQRLTVLFVSASGTL